MKLDRLLGILTILLQKDRVSAPELAERFEVNRRTIGRDIDALCQAGIPVIAHQGSGGGFSIAEGFKLDKSVLTVSELSSIVAAIKGLGSVSDKPAIERTLDKLHAGSGAVVSMREPIIIDLASFYGEQLTEKIELIKRAALENALSRMGDGGDHVQRHDAFAGRHKRAIEERIEFEQFAVLKDKIPLSVHIPHIGVGAHDADGLLHKGGVDGVVGAHQQIVFAIGKLCRQHYIGKIIQIIHIATNANPILAVTQGNLHRRVCRLVIEKDDFDRLVCLRQTTLNAFVQITGMIEVWY